MLCEMLSFDDVVLISDIIEEFLHNLTNLKEATERKGVNNNL